MDNDSPTVYEPQSVAHPGEIVVDYLEFNGWSQRELARRSGLTPKTISEICSGKAPISPTTALAFEKVLQRPAHFWLNLQRCFDEAEARKQVATKYQSWQEWARRFPVGDMVRSNFIDSSATKEARVETLLKFFGVSSPDIWQTTWSGTQVSYRQTRKFEKSEEAISAWVRATEIVARDLNVGDYNEGRLKEIIPELRRQTSKPAPQCIDAVQQLCASAGVAVVWVPELPNTRISGCTRWLSERRALIGLTLRYHFDDQIWFTFFHELGHVLLHRKRHMFVLDNADIDLGDNVVDPEMQRSEEEANRFAADTLIPPEKLADFIRLRQFTNESIRRFSEDLCVGPGIVVGRLQFEGFLKPYQGNTLKRRFYGVTEAR